MLRRALTVTLLASVVLVPLASTPASAATTARARTAPLSSAVWRSSATRRAVHSAARPTAVSAPVAVSPAQAYLDRVVLLTNAERTSRGLAPLSVSGCASGFAQTWSGHLLELATLEHQSLGPVLDSCAASAVGENVAYGNLTPEALVALWMGSEGHRANILNPTYNRIGTGASTSSAGRVYGVQVFLRA